MITSFYFYDIIYSTKKISCISRIWRAFGHRPISKSFIHWLLVRYLGWASCAMLPFYAADIYHARPFSLQWRRNKRDDATNHRHLDCLLNPLFRYRSKKTSKLRVTGLCKGNPPEGSGMGAWIHALITFKYWIKLIHARRMGLCTVSNALAFTGSKGYFRERYWRKLWCHIYLIMKNCETRHKRSSVWLTFLPKITVICFCATISNEKLNSESDANSTTKCVTLTNLVTPIKHKLQCIWSHVCIKGLLPWNDTRTTQFCRQKGIKFLPRTEQNTREWNWRKSGISYCTTHVMLASSMGEGARHRTTCSRQACILYAKLLSTHLVFGILTFNIFQIISYCCHAPIVFKPCDLLNSMISNVCQRYLGIWNTTSHPGVYWLYKDELPKSTNSFDLVPPEPKNNAR